MAQQDSLVVCHLNHLNLLYLAEFFRDISTPHPPRHPELLDLDNFPHYNPQSPNPLD